MIFFSKQPLAFSFVFQILGLCLLTRCVNWWRGNAAELRLITITAGRMTLNFRL